MDEPPHRHFDEGKTMGSDYRLNDAERVEAAVSDVSLAVDLIH